MQIFTIANKEFRSLLFSPLPWIFLIVFVLVLSGTWFLTGTRTIPTFFAQNSSDLAGFFQTMPLALAALVPALAMKLWPDELKSGTIELLMSYPLRAWQIVLGKYLAGLYLVLIALGLTAIVPWTVAQYGEIDMGPMIGGYLASLLLGASFLSMGLFFGALAKEQVTAFIMTALFCAFFVVIGDTVTTFNVPRSLDLLGLTVDVQQLSEMLSFSSRFEYLGRGVVPLADVLYFAIFGATFLVLNVVVLECRKGK